MTKGVAVPVRAVRARQLMWRERPPPAPVAREGPPLSAV